MHLHRIRLMLFGALAMAAAAGLDRPAAAQNPWSRGTELGVGTGIATSAAATGSALDGFMDWDVNRRFGIEGAGSWFDQGSGSEGFAAVLGGWINLVPRQTLTPFVGAGFGFYRASFDSPAVVSDSFYRKRLSAQSSGPGSSVVFTDPLLRVSGGVDILARRHLAIRPEVGVLVVRGGGNSRTMGTFGVRFAFRFEDHPVTP